MYLFNLLSQTLIERLKSTEISIGFVHKNGICLKASSAISIDCVYDFKGCIKSAQILENQSSEEKKTPFCLWPFLPGHCVCSILLCCSSTSSLLIIPPPPPPHSSPPRSPPPLLLPVPSEVTYPILPSQSQLI